eukprot:g2600.t1
MADPVGKFAPPQYVMPSFDDVMSDPDFPEMKRFVRFLHDTLGPSSDETADELHKLGTAYADEGLVEQAGAILTRVVEIRERSLGGTHHDTQSARHLLQRVREAALCSESDSEGESEGDSESETATSSESDSSWCVDSDSKTATSENESDVRESAARKKQLKIWRGAGSVGRSKDPHLVASSQRATTSGFDL